MPRGRVQVAAAACSMTSGALVRFSMIGGAAEDAGSGVHLVAQLDEDVALDVLQADGQHVALDVMRDVMQDEVAIAVGEGDLQSRFHVETGAPAGEFLRRGSRGQIEGDVTLGAYEAAEKRRSFRDACPSRWAAAR